MGWRKVEKCRCGGTTFSRHNSVTYVKCNSCDLVYFADSSGNVPMEEYKEEEIVDIESKSNLISEITPTKDGWYWAYENLEEGDADWLCVAVRGGKAYALELSFNLSEFSHWMGPLPVPPIPKVEWSQFGEKSIEWSQSMNKLTK